MIKYNKLQSQNAKKGRKTFLQVPNIVSILKLSQISRNEAAMCKIIAQEKQTRVDSLNHSIRKTGKSPNSQHPLHFLTGHQENENALNLTKSITKRDIISPYAHTFDFGH